MIRLSHALAGGSVEIRFVERAADVAEFLDWLSTAPKILGLDTESTGLAVYSPSWRLRTAQIGDGRVGWVFDVNLHRGVVLETLRSSRFFAIHNAAYDLQSIERGLGVKAEELLPRTFDTKILAHLLDPRGKDEGGIGHRLKDLATVYVDPEAKDADLELGAEFRRHGWTKATGWANIQLVNETYLRYAGLDPILAFRMFEVISELVEEAGLDRLSMFEHELQGRMIELMRRGILLDVPYTTNLVGELTAESEHFAAIAAELGVENINSTAQVSSALLAMGEKLTETTEAGNVKVDKAVMLPLADLSLQWERLEVREPNPLADAVVRAKRSSKWASTYGQACLDARDAFDRVHPSINSLQARTARMSISGPPLQQLPSGDWTIRRMFVAEPGNVILAADYSQVEMRVLAALCEDRTMIEAIRSGEDLHDFTAKMIYGDGFTKKQRKIAKGVGFGKVYGGGAATLSRQTGAELEAVKEAIRGYDRTFPGVKRLSRRLSSRAEYGKKEVVTPSGRHLPLDRDRLYSATNYLVQSTSRDVLADAIIRIFDAGLGDYLLLPVHDELVASAPEGDAAEVLRGIQEAMNTDFFGVPIASDGSIYGRSWGHGYGATD